MKRRTFIAGMAAGVTMASPVLAQQNFMRQGNVISVPVGSGEVKPMELSRPWGQVLRTFGDPVLEGHFSMRVMAREGTLDMAMWDRGDRILGIGQYGGRDAQDLWPVVEAVMARHPDLKIGPGAYMFRSDHYETAHWQIDEVVANRTGRYEEMRAPKAASWMRPSNGIAKAIRPLTRDLGPPDGSYTHVLWTEPVPEVPGGPGAVGRIDLGSGNNPGIERRLLDIAESKRMFSTISARVAQPFIESLGPLVPFRATLTNVHLPDGRLWGRCRFLSV